MAVKRGKIVFCGGVIVLIGFFSGLCADEYKVIRDPRPTVEEKNYIPLERVGTIREELGGDQYLFHATAGVVDGKGRLFLMDALQGKVLIFDARHKYIRSFGRHGVGPGEFMKSDRRSPIIMSIGLDGNLWVNEFNNLRISVFNTEGKFLRHVRLAQSPSMLLQADSNGNLLLNAFERDKVVFYNTAKKILFNLPHPGEIKERLFYKPELDPKVLEFDKNTPFQYDSFELQYLLIDDRTLLILFTQSGDCILARDGKIERRFRLWPKDLITYYRNRTPVDKKKEISLFFKMSAYCDNRERIFLETFYKKNGAQYFIYEMSVNGDITAVYFFDKKKHGGVSFMLAAGRDIFYFMHDDGVDIFKPKKQ